MGSRRRPRARSLRGGTSSRRFPDPSGTPRRCGWTGRPGSGRPRAIPASRGRRRCRDVRAARSLTFTATFTFTSGSPRQPPVRPCHHGRDLGGGGRGRVPRGRHRGGARAPQGVGGRGGRGGAGGGAGGGLGGSRLGARARGRARGGGGPRASRAPGRGAPKRGGRPRGRGAAPSRG